MSKEQNTIRGQVIECLPNLSYKVSVEDNGEEKEVRAYLSGKMKVNKIRVLIGDKVELVVPDTGEIYRLIRRL